MSEIRIDHSDLAALAYSILAEGHVLRFSAPGYSMFPFIRDGDIVEVQPLNNWHPRAMDIIVYAHPNGKVRVHRLDKVRQTDAGLRLYLRGDAPPFCGEWIESGQVLGRVAAVEHAERRVRMDSRLMRSMAWLWAAAMPFSAYILRLGIFFFHIVRRFSKGSS